MKTKPTPPPEVLGSPSGSDSGPCIYCDAITSEGRFEMPDVPGEIEGGAHYAHDNCYKLSILKFENHAEKRLKENPDDPACRAVAGVANRMADLVCNPNAGREALPPEGSPPENG